MFQTPRPNFYESSHGFSVEVLGRTGLTYREGERKMFVDSEVLLGPEGIGIYSSSIRRWDPPYENQAIDSAAKERIINNIRDVFRYQGFEIVVI